MKKILQDFGFAEIENLIISFGEKKFRAKQLYEGLTKGKKISEINVPAELRNRLLEEYEDEPVKIEKTFVSSDGTEKFLFALADGNLIEGVLMKYRYGYTQCVSTQVGCRMGCKFCASTLGGLIRRDIIPDFNGERASRRSGSETRGYERCAYGKRRTAR